jgi:1-aminocyclopropane-1-carboxylate deaminase
MDVLRADLLHPVISGNKWYKLSQYLKDAEVESKRTILTYGGAFSNHIIATAAMCKERGLSSIGIIRGEKPARLSYTLRDAEDYGMHLYYNSREDYKKRIIHEDVWQQHNRNETVIVNEGGYGMRGKLGAARILTGIDLKQYSHIACAVGTGTTLAGLASSSLPQQQVLGFSVFKNNYALQEQINHLLPVHLHDKFLLFHEFHFGGYAKCNAALIEFMNEWYRQTLIPLDFVYTAKLFFGINALIKDNYFPAPSKILIIHSGGLQGNRSLMKGTLIFNQL